MSLPFTLNTEEFLTEGEILGSDGAGDNSGVSAPTKSPAPFVLHQADEEPWHKLAVFMFGSGETSYDVVADNCGVSREVVLELFHKPWFQSRVQALLEQNGRDCNSLIEAERFNSILTLIKLRDDVRSGPKLRAEIARDFLDRTLGKAITRVQTTQMKPSDDPVAETARLEKELERWAKQGIVRMEPTTS